MKKLVLGAVVLLSLYGTGCSRGDRLPEGVLSVDAYADLLTDLYKAEGYFAITSDYQYKNLGSDMAATYDTLLATHGVTDEIMTATTDYYLNHRDQYKQVYELVVEHLGSAE